LTELVVHSIFVIYALIAFFYYIRHHLISLLTFTRNKKNYFFHSC